MKRAGMVFLMAIGVGAGLVMAEHNIGGESGWAVAVPAMGAAACLYLLVQFALEG